MPDKTRESIELPQVSVKEEEGRLVVVKSFQGNPGILKWVALGLIYQGAYPFAVTPEARMRRELDFMNAEHEFLRTPRILRVDWGRKEVTREYVEGAPLEPWNRPEDSGILGQAIAMAHREGWVLGDTKPTNFVLSEEGHIYVVDAEQSLTLSDNRLRGWDLLVSFFFLSIMYPMDARTFRDRVEGLLTSYLASRGFREALDNVFNYRHSTLYALIPIHHLITLRSVINDNKRSWHLIRGQGSE
jgi:tRNA A-37 threonylcarbamoyl transferase component Bud32